MDNVVNTCIAYCTRWLYCVLIVWVALATVYIQINARPSMHPAQIPPSVLYELTQVKTIEDLLQMLDQTVRPVIPEQGKNTPNTAWNLPDDELDQGDEDEDDDDDDDKNDDDDDDGDDIYSKQEPVSALIAEHPVPRTKLTPSQFSLADTSRRPVDEVAQVYSHQPSPGLQINDVESLPSCVPRESVMQVPSDPSEPNVVYWPGCVTVKRCGGCCNTELFECQATRSEIVQRKLIRMEYTPRSITNFQYDGVVVKNVSQDTNCSCQCKVKPQDCNPTTQIHRNCQCECKAWASCPSKKQWDPIRCQCFCSASQTQRICAKVRQEWNEDSCSCTCRRDIIAKCRAPHRFSYRRCRCERRST